MRWIHSPLWDGFWILSGLPIGLALMLLSPGMVTPLIVVVMVLESAHVVCPTLLAWMTPGLRRIFLKEWREHVVAPVGVMIAVLLLDPAIVVGIYFAWNIFHFGMQNFGIASLYRPGSSYDARIRRGLACLAITTLGMGVIPLFHNQPLNMLCMGVFSFNHWLADIGLSSRVARWHWGFVAVVLLVGVVWLLLRNGPLSVHVVPQISVIRCGIGFVHFIDSARIWKRDAAVASLYMR